MTAVASVAGAEASPNGSLADLPAGTPPGELTVLMEAVRDSAARLLSGLAHPPTALRLRVGAVEMALEWQPAVPPAAVEAAAAAPVAAAASPVPADPPAQPVPSARIDSPTVGVFYHAPEPGAAPFVRVGDVVAPGRQVGIVEVMKLMIPVEADRAGRITGVLVDNGGQVEYGEALFSLEPVSPDGR